MFGLFAPQVPQVSAQEVAARLSRGEPLLVVDVREPNEYAGGHIPGSRLIPLGSLAQRLAELPRDRSIVAVCRSGARSASATRQLKAAGYEVVNMAGGMLAWQGAVTR